MRDLAGAWIFYTVLPGWPWIRPRFKRIARFAPLIGLTGLAALAFARPQMPPAAFACIGFAFVAWAALSEFWSPGSRQIVSGSLLEGTFAVEARSLES